MPVVDTPTLTISVPIFNEEKRIGRLLQSIRMQTYPSEKVEVLVIDGGSTDRSREVSARFECTVLDNPSRDPEVGKQIGCLHASGDLHMYMDADMEWCDETALANLVRPWLEVDGLAGSFPRFEVDPRDPPFNRYLSAHPLYQDPLMRFLSPSIADTVVSRHESYALCHFTPARVPVVGIILYPTSFVRDVALSQPGSHWIDVDFAAEAAARGLTPIAYVPNARIFHRSALNRAIYLQKLRRNIRTVYLGTLASRRSTYASWDRRLDLARLLIWFLYANTIVLPLGLGVAKVLKHRDAAMLYEAWATTVGTNYVAAQFLADARGRTLLRRAAKSLVRRDDPRADARSGAVTEGRG